MAFPRSPDRGPIEAGVVGGWPEGQPLDFRDHQIAAPLKHCALTLKRKMDVIFPRSPDRGPIEALSVCAWCWSCAAAFPRSPDRGPIEAGRFAGAFALVFGFPRSPDRGPIEARG